MKKYTTQQVADLIGVNKSTLLRWLYKKKIPEPKRIRFDQQSYRIWSSTDVERARAYKREYYAKKPRKKLISLV